MNIWSTFDLNKNIMPTKRKEQWLDEKYSNSKEINIFVDKKLEYSDFLKIESFTNLKSISLKKFKLISLEITNCHQLTKVNLSELSKLKSLSISDCPKLTELDCSRIKSLDELEVRNLTLLNCSSTSIKDLRLNLCPNIINLNCSNNEKLINLDISNCSKLEFLDCSDTSLTKLNLSNCSIDIKVNHPPKLEITFGKGDRKNLLLIGMTGSGKSTLANVLTETEDFKESAYAISETKQFRKQDFDWEGTKYRLVDNIGIIGDTKLPIKDVLYKIAEGIYSIPEGISQVLFVVDGRFTQKEVATFDLLKRFIFETNILEYITIVRTKFPNFRNKKERDLDKQKLIEGNEAVAEIINSCNDVIHVDNPPTNVIREDAFNDVNKIVRKKSRTILLDHLKKVCQKEYLKLKEWDVVQTNILKYLEENSEYW